MRETDLLAVGLSRMGCSRQQGDASLTSQLYGEHNEDCDCPKVLKFPTTDEAACSEK